MLAKEGKMKTIIYLFLILTQYIFSQNYKNDITGLEKTVVAICHTEPLIKNIMGTGFIYNSSGLVITADHVITDDKGNIHNKLMCIRPMYPNVEYYDLKILKRFREGLKGRDIALLQMNINDTLSNVNKFSISDTAKINEEVLIVGFPLIFDKVYIWPILRKGIVSSTRYNYQNSKILLLDLASVSGFSGSPIISLNSRTIIGVLAGKSKMNPTSDFSVGTKLFKMDIDGYIK